MMTSEDLLKASPTAAVRINAKVYQCQHVDSGLVGRMAEWMVIQLDSCDKYLHDVMIMTKIIELLQPDFTRARVAEPLVVTASDSRRTAVYAHLPFLEGESKCAKLSSVSSPPMTILSFFISTVYRSALFRGPLSRAMTSPTSPVQMLSQQEWYPRNQHHSLAEPRLLIARETS